MMMKIFVLFVLLGAVGAEQQQTKKQTNIVLAANTKDVDAKALRQTLRLREPGALTTHRQASTTREAAKPNGLAGELKDTLRLLDELERDQMLLLDAVKEASRISRLQTQANAGAKQTTNRTLSLVEELTSGTKLENQRDRNRGSRQQNRQGVQTSRHLSNDYVRSSRLDAQDRIQSARSEAASSRIRTIADARDTLIDLRGKQVEDRFKYTADLRNRLQASRVDMLTARLEANAAQRQINRQGSYKRRMERLNRLAKAREAYANAYALGEATVLL